jgi:O-antigen/teichoic acid export membrane protein
MNLRIFGKNAFIYSIGNIALRAGAFLLIPLYTRFLSIDEYGMLATLLLTMQVLMALIDMGARTAIVRFAAQYENENRTAGLIGTSTLIIIIAGLIVTGVTAILFAPVFRTILHLQNVTEVLILTCMASMSQSLYLHIVSYYRARNEGLKVLLASLGSLTLLVIVSMLFLIQLKSGIRGVLVAQILTYGLLWIVLITTTCMRTGASFSLHIMIRLIRFGLPIIFAMSGDIFTDVVAVYFLSYFSSLHDVAIYSLAAKIAQIAIIAFIAPFQLSYEPFIYSSSHLPDIREQISRLFTFMLIGYAFVAFGIAFIARSLIPIMAPPEYGSASVILFLLLPGYAFRGIYYIGQSQLYIKNKTLTAGIIVTVFTVLSFVLNYLLIPLYGSYGVVIVFNITLISTALAMMFFGQKSFAIPIQKVRVFVALALMLVFIFLVHLLQKSSFYIYYSILPLTGVTTVYWLCRKNYFANDKVAQVFCYLNQIKLKFAAMI